MVIGDPWRALLRRDPHGHRGVGEPDEFLELVVLREPFPGDAAQPEVGVLA